MQRKKGEKTTQNKFYFKYQTALHSLGCLPAWEGFWCCQRLYAGKSAFEPLGENLCQAVSGNSNRSPKKKNYFQWQIWKVRKKIQMKEPFLFNTELREDYLLPKQPLWWIHTETNASTGDHLIQGACYAATRITRCKSQCPAQGTETVVRSVASSIHQLRFCFLSHRQIKAAKTELHRAVTDQTIAPRNSNPSMNASAHPQL